MDDKTPADSQRSGFHVDPRFINLRPIGQGGNAIVYSATDSDCEKEVAIKKISFNDKRSCKYALREIRLMRRLQHENVVTVYEVLGSNGYSLEKGGGVNCNLNEISSVYIVQELLHADLHQLIQQDQLSREHVKLFTYQLLRGLKYIHSANVLHRDLKPMNLLVNVEDLVLKIADFGLARVMDEEYSHKGFLTDNVGTCWYRSPELIVSPRDYTKAIDIWSVGCVLAEMISGRPLFPGAHEMDQIGLILDTVCLSDNEWNRVTQILPQSFIRRHTRLPSKPIKDMFTNVDIDALDLLERLLEFDPSLRLTAEEALAHPYLQEYSCVEDEPIVLSPFHIEHEVDELSPKSSRRVISQEMSKSVELCGVDNQTQSKNVAMETSKHDSQGDITVIVDNDPDTIENDTEVLTDYINSEEQDSNKPNTPVVADLTYIEDYLSNRLSESETSAIKKATDTAKTDNKFQTSDNETNENETNSSSSSREFIDLIPVAFNEISDLEHQIKNLQMVVEIPDEENRKEQMSPKENKDTGSEKDKVAKDRENINTEKLFVKVDYLKPGSKVATQKAKDILNQERRSESPKHTGADKQERIDFIHIEKEKHRNSGSNEKFRNVKKEKKKKKRRNNRTNSSDNGQDFDALYRLPTEHLTRHRNSICSKDRHTGTRTVEEQLRLHEELNEKRKMAEMDKEFVGAVGGVHCELEESLHQERSRLPGGGNASPTSEHSRDSSPSTDEPNIHRRFER